jgi:membrane-associated protease RseP (regulator of RpoE activity)
MDVLPEDADRQFWMRAPWKRIIVMFAGPFMNLILAVVLFAIVLMGIGVPASGTTVGTVSACVVPATVQSDTCPAGAPQTPAAEAGFRPGDRIVSFNGQQLDPTDGEGLRAAIQGAKGQVTVVVERGGQLVTLTPTLIANQVADVNDPNKTVQASFLGVGLVGVYARQNIGAVFVQIGDIVGRTGQALVQLPSRVPGLFGSVFLGEQRDQNGPVGIVGASRIGGQILALDAPASAEFSFFLQLLAAVNISLFLFNLLPIPPLDGGQIFPAIWEAIKKRGARALGRPDPGPVDVAKLMPVAYVVALVFIAWSGLLFVADIINPVLLPQ